MGVGIFTQSLCAKQKTMEHIMTALMNGRDVSLRGSNPT
jgi:hypothetical protein